MVQIPRNEFNRLVESLRNKGLATYNSKSKFQGDPQNRGSWVYNYVQDQLYKVLGTPDQVQIIE